MDVAFPPEPPVARKHPHVETHHGITRVDPYAWLRAGNWREVMRNPSALSSEIRAHLEAENDYARAVMEPTVDLQRALFEEMKARIKEDDSTVPSPDGPYAYGIRFVAGGQHPLFIRTARDGSAEEVLIDGNRLAEGRPYFNFGPAAHSPDQRLFAWSFDAQGSEFHTIHIRDIATGSDLADEIVETTGTAVWSADSRHIFYVWVDENHRQSKVFRHLVGTPQTADELIYEEQDPGFFLGLSHTQSSSYVTIRAHDHETAEVRLVSTSDALEPARLVAAREPGVDYHVDEGAGVLYILTNADGAEDYKIATAPVSSPDRRHWRDLLPHETGRLILNATIYARHLVRLETVAGLPRIVVHRLADGAEHAIGFDEEAYSLGLAGGYEFDTDTVRFTYSSLTTPAQVYDYDLETRERTLRKEQEVPSGHDPAHYVTRRILAPAPDGETVPVSLLYHRDTPLDGSAPCWLYGYGAYGLSIPAAFNTNWLSLAGRGFVFAIAHVRGGKEKGYRWYRLGKREHKPNTFTDFIAAGRHLAAQRFTSEGDIVGHGGSAGGLLIGAVANMAPDLFRALIGQVPFVDVLSTMLDASLPLTPPEWPEWGNPLASPDDYRLIASYSPYDNVAAKPYPHILAVAGLTDPRVTYWEPAKWVARLRELKTDGNLLLLDTKMGAGHQGAPGRFDRLKEIALVYAFGLTMTGKG